RISVKNLTVILETIADFAAFTKNPDDLAEQARRRLGVYFIRDFESQPGVIRALTLEPRLEQTLVARIKRTQFEISLMMDPLLAQHLLKTMGALLGEMSDEGMTPIVMVTAELRLAFKRFFEPSFPRMAVLAYQELPEN
ncbi:MAG TPA: FHIPEP family type III secretion protein, partial [Opitutales bacterium]|nr:FHIPEP family type III secretion protein [Opitutales bacterium]